MGRPPARVSAPHRAPARPVRPAAYAADGRSGLCRWRSAPRRRSPRRSWRRLVVGEQILERLADLGSLAFEEMRSAVDHRHFLRLLELRVKSPEALDWADLLKVSNHEELRLGGLQRARVRVFLDGRRDADEQR